MIINHIFEYTFLMSDLLNKSSTRKENFALFHIDVNIMKQTHHPTGTY